MTPPSADDLVGPGPIRTLDEKEILRNFLGRTAAEVRAAAGGERFFTTEDYMWMAPEGLKYYLPPLFDYLRSPKSVDDFETSHMLLCSLSFQVEHSKLPDDLIALIREVADYVDSNRKKLDLEGPESLLDEYLKTIRGRRP